MKVIKKGRIKVPFREIVNGDVFYSNDFDDYAMKILPKVHRDVNAVLLTDGDLVFIPNDDEVELTEVELVERD